MSKRPFAESSASFHSSARVRLEEQESTFSLFERTDLATLEATVFDGQLSDLSSLSDESELPLTDFEVSSDEATEDPFSISGTAPSGDWTGIRKSKHGYHLPKANEVLRGPDPEDIGPNPTRLDDNQKSVTRGFSKYLMDNWPSKKLNAELAGGRHIALVDATGFWEMLLSPFLPLYVDSLENKDEKNKSRRVS